MPCPRSLPRRRDSALRVSNEFHSAAFSALSSTPSKSPQSYSNPVAILYGNLFLATRLRRRNSAGSMPSSCAAWSTRDRKSTRLNSSHGYISYAVFCLKKKKKKQHNQTKIHKRKQDMNTRKKPSP